MSVYALDSFHPDVLKCCDCGEAVVNFGDLGQAEPEPAPTLTRRQAVACWPGAARELVTHDLVCFWRQRDAQALDHVHEGR
jgi:hypothetical protein